MTRSGQNSLNQKENPLNRSFTSLVHSNTFFNESLVYNLKLHHAMPHARSVSIQNSMTFSVNIASIKFNNVSFSGNTAVNPSV